MLEVLFSDLQKLVGVPLPRDLDQLTEILSYVKGEAESLEEDVLSIEVKDGNRPDLWCIEGIARMLRGAIGIDKGLMPYSIEGFSHIQITVHSKLEHIRPYIACSLVRGVHLTDDIVGELMHLQDKLDQTYGRQRRRTSIGLYNFGLITPPLKYSVANPDKMKFVPLGNEDEMSLREIVARHPKGVEYGHIVKEYEQWPILLDSQNRVLSFPPIINSCDLGKITKDVEDVFVEVTGTVYQTVLNALTTVTLSLADRDGHIFSTEVNYPYGSKGSDTTPKLVSRKVKIEMTDVNRILGLEIALKDALTLLQRARYDVKPIDGNAIETIVPCYRMDIMHPLDIIEDIAIMYGYNRIKPHWPTQITFGELSEIELFSDLVREVMLGLGFQEILSFVLTNQEQLFTKMNLESVQEVVELLNPMSSRFTLLRNWLIPSLMEFLSKNTHAEYPQKIFEVGDCAFLDGSHRTGVTERRTVACLIAHSNSNFSEIKAILDALSLNVGFKYNLQDCVHNSFIAGRVGYVLVHGENVGIIGEVNPRVLESWGLTIPVTVLEVHLPPLLSGVVN